MQAYAIPLRAYLSSEDLVDLLIAQLLRDRARGVTLIPFVVAAFPVAPHLLVVEAIRHLHHPGSDQYASIQLMSPQRLVRETLDQAQSSAATKMLCTNTDAKFLRQFLQWSMGMPILHSKS